MCGQTDRQNDKPSTVALAAHARRGLIIVNTKEFKQKLRAQMKKANCGIINRIIIICNYIIIYILYIWY